MPEKDKVIAKNVKVMNDGITRAHLLTGDGVIKRGSMRPSQKSTPRPPPPQGQGGNGQKQSELKSK